MSGHPRPSPGWLAGYDQDMATADHELDAAVSGLRAMITQHGEVTAMASLALMLPEDLPQEALLGMLATALRRLALADEEEGKEAPP
jgi:hypothetical protein